MTNTFFTSDHHFYHENILEYSRRPFASLEEMHESLIENWNRVVKRGDLVYYLGDFSMTWKKPDQDKVEKILARLNGSKHLIRGNHDRDPCINAKGWSWVGDYKRAVVQKQRIIMFHYCIRSWHGIHRGSWHLYGHSHGSLRDNGGGKCMDVGVDCNDYTPVSYETIEAYMSTRNITSVDHHGE